jgi:hypothetical protein
MGASSRRVALGVAATAAIVVAAVLAATAPAKLPPTGPIAHIAFPSNGGTEVSHDTIPAGGTGGIATDQLPPAVTQAQIDIRPQVSGQAEYDKLQAFLAPQHLRGRIMSCIALSLAALKGLTGGKKGIKVAFEDEESSLPFLFLVMCVSMAYDTPFSPAHDAGAASAGCHQLGFSAPVTITKVGGKYRGTVNGTVSTPPRAAYTVSCKHLGKDLVISIKPRKRGQSLRKTYGSNLGVQVFNPTNRAIPITATFKATK